MIYKNFSNILTDHGFVQLDRSIRKNNYKIAYIDNGELKFTDNYSYNIILPKSTKSVIGDYNLKCFIGGRTNLYDKNFNLINPSKGDNVLTSYKCVNEDCESEYTNKSINLSFSTKEHDNISIDITRFSFYKLAVLILMFSKKSSKQDKTLRLYLTKNSNVNREIINTLNDIIGEETFSVFYQNKIPTTIYIDSKQLSVYIDKIGVTFNTILNYPYHSIAFCDAMVDLASVLGFYDINYQGSFVLIGSRLNEYIHYISAFLVINGFNYRFKRLPDGKFELVFINKNTKAVYNVNAIKNIKNSAYVSIEMEKSYPMFIQETRDWVSSSTIVPSSTFEDSYEDDEDDIFNIL